VTESQLEAFQKIINGTAANFKRTVAAGRNMSLEDVEGIATGQTWLAADALELRLIDKVVDPEPEEQVENKPNDKKGDVMSTKQTDIEQGSSVDTEAIAAQAREDESKRLEALRAAFPDDLPFAIEQFKAGATLEQAKAAMCDKLMEEKKNAPAPKPAKSDEEDEAVSPIGAGHTAADGDSEDFMEEARAMKKANPGMKMTEAMRFVAKEQPELHQKFLDACATRTVKINPGKAARVSK